MIKKNHSKSLLRIGTRRSLLALIQANIVADAINKINPDIAIKIIEIVTTGDKLYNANLALIGGKGLFLKEIEEELIADNIDIAVHSMKDVPAEIPPALTINCVLPREDARDALISNKYKSLNDLPSGAIIGTSSTRRKEQLLLLRPDLKVIPFRGNINTRITKVKNMEADACMLAFAGLKRANLSGHIVELFSTDVMIPSVCQGIICIEQRRDDVERAELLAQINHTPSMILARAERAFMKGLQGNCVTPLAANAVFNDDEHIILNACYFDNSSRCFKVGLTGDRNNPELLGELAANKIRENLERVNMD